MALEAELRPLIAEKQEKLKEEMMGTRARDRRCACGRTALACAARFRLPSKVSRRHSAAVAWPV